jgi:LacI family transcriptional regulator
MSALTPITQRDVAQACGLHPSTVCLALKNSPSIPLATRLRIQAVATDLGYQLNVAARNLALLRNEKKIADNFPLAWINQEPRSDHWRTNRDARVLFDGARRRASESGYHLEEIWTQEPGMNAARVVQILSARGIEGVIFPTHYSFDFSLLTAGWGEFAMVGVNDHRLSEWVDVVCPDYHRNMQLALRRLRHVGFERIGLVMTSQFDAASNGLAHGCYLRHQAEARHDGPLPVCFVSDAADQSVETCSEWIGQHQPDAIIGPGAVLEAAMNVRGNDVAWVELHGMNERLDANVDACASDIAGVAVDCVVEKVRRFEKGTRDSTRLHLVKGCWHERNLAGRLVETVVA